MSPHPSTSAASAASSPRPSHRVGVVVSQLGFGGAERQTFELLRALAATPRRPEGIICLSDGLEPYGPRLEELGYPLEVIGRSGSFDVRRLLALRRAIRRRQWQVVHAVHLLASGYCHLATWGTSVRVLPTVRGTVVHPGRIKSAVYRSMFRKAPRILANSHAGAEFIAQAFAAPKEAIHVVPNGLDFEPLRARATSGDPRAELGLDAGAQLIGFVGKDSRVKNVPRFLDVARRLLHERPDRHVVLLGHGLGADSRFRAGAPDRTHFIGPRDDAPAWLQSMDLLLLTSNSEGCPNVVLEACALGTPVVAADVGDVARMVGPAGHAVRADDIEAYVERSESWLEMGRSEARRRVQSAAPEMERTYSLSAMVDRTVALWSELAR